MHFDQCFIKMTLFHPVTINVVKALQKNQSRSSEEKEK